MAIETTIRRLVETDLVAYKALRDTTLAAHPLAFVSDADEERSKAPASYLPRLGLQRPEGGHFTLGAWRREDLVGAISGDRDPRKKARHMTLIVGMMVRDEVQGLGVGRALLDACIAEARRADGVSMLTLTVTEGNVPAIRLYEGAGFVRCGSLQRAICVDGAYHAKNQMVLML
jgi:GNAT superfamily N-acetyltransferase